MSEKPNLADELTRRMDQLEEENLRLRRRLEKIDPEGASENPCFDPRLFQRAMGRFTALLIVPTQIAGALLMVAILLTPLRSMRIGPMPVFDIGGMNSRVLPSLGLGIVAIGAGAVGIFAYGGLAVGVFASGGGAIGLFALGGGAFGLIAIGGGAVGWVAIGGGAVGRYALGQRAAGKYVLSLTRQDPEAIAFFTRFVPGLRAAVTTPMPVILLKQDT